MEQEPRINVSFEEILIKEISFNRSDKIEMRSYNIECIDIVSVASVEQDGFRLEYCRKTKTKEPFSFSVVFDCFCRLDDSSKEKIKNNIDKLNEMAEKHKEEIVSNLNLPAKASQVIADITSHLGTPYISRPLIIQNKK